ncbi:MAG: NAD-dependent epimerase/dehydratase family protein [Sulfurifustaceae bacterium]
MKILITGNMGYVGPTVVERLRREYPDARLVGFDMGYFAHCLSGVAAFPERRLDAQIIGDVRTIGPELLEGVDAIVHLAAISNDPMGNAFEALTAEVNQAASVRLAQLAKRAGVRRFVFASSCSMYGAAESRPRVEHDPLNPLTAYARSKVGTEGALREIAGDGFVVTALRFATACGMSARLRLDLVLNDFVAGAMASKEISILSDGTPWRPLIHVQDMARAIEWAIGRDVGQGGAFLAVNVGADEWNYQVRELAEAVARGVPGVRISINPHAPPDKRSYRVSFDLFRRLAPRHQPQVDLSEAIEGLKDGLAGMGFRDPEFRSSGFIRLRVLARLRALGELNERFEWVRQAAA